jgi:hypothetical protein
MSSQLLKRQAVIDLARAWPGSMASVDKPRVKKPMGIEALLHWAFCEELPKVPRIEAPADMPGAWDKVAEWAEELSLAGLDDNRFGVVPDLTAQVFPHTDALLVHDAVCRLDLCALTLPDDWSPLGDLGDMGGHAGAVAADALAALTIVDAEGLRRLRRSPRRLVMRHAILGGAPSWEIDAPDVRFVQANGCDRWFLREVVVVEGRCGPVSMEIEVDGFDTRRRVPKPEAYRKTMLEPDPTLGCIGRAEYEVWRAALDVVTEDLRGSMYDHEVVDCPRPARPWEEPAREPVRVLPDLRRIWDSRLLRGRRKKNCGGA